MLHTMATAVGAVGVDQGLTSSAGGALDCVARVTQTDTTKDIVTNCSKRSCWHARAFVHFLFYFRYEVAPQLMS